MTLPPSVAELLDLGHQADAGLAALGSALGILQYTPANFGPLVQSLQDQQDTFNAARTAAANASATYQQRFAAMRKAVSDARKVFSISWGDDWNAAWVQAGWNDNTTEVPREPAPLAALCASIGAFLSLGQNDVYIVNTQKVVVIDTRFNAFVGDTGTFTTAESALAATRAARATQHGDRDDDVEALRKALRGLIGVLGEKLGPLDPRWDQFGLPRPGAKSLPGVPTGLALSKAGTGPVTVTAQCDPTPTATYYRWFGKLAGVDANFRFLGRTKDPLLLLAGQPAAGHLDVKVEAANEAGPGKASAAVGIVLG